MSHPSTAPAHPSRLALYARLVRIDKPIGTLLLLWPTLWAMWMAAGGPPGWTLFWIFFAGTFLMRSAGCAMNDWADRDFDKHVKRTKERPLTAGLIASWEALAVAAVLALIALALILPLNSLTKWLAVVAAVLAGTYPFFKRFSRSRKRTWASHSASASRWPSRRSRIRCRSWPG
jgi:4-hydroxybenzoate polyprenyltransferase